MTQGTNADLNTPHALKMRWVWRCLPHKLPLLPVYRGQSPSPTPVLPLQTSTTAQRWVGGRDKVTGVRIRHGAAVP